MSEPEPAEIVEQEEYIGALDLAGYNVGYLQLYEGQTNDRYLHIVKWLVVTQQRPNKMAMRGKHRILQTYYLWFEILRTTNGGMLIQRVDTFNGKGTGYWCPTV
ncbi:MAG: hypothetical protein GY696_08475 [Gammaproteobacteria bacterium]|nr:hypothetical protein [Gammaproteobacteria bacterium]